MNTPNASLASLLRIASDVLAGRVPDPDDVATTVVDFGLTHSSNDAIQARLTAAARARAEASFETARERKFGPR